ncbi:P-loop containing nucleoside triphosphate hydrolase protein [Cladorrhinum samala]|uniref:P-loop containing nucleoside triphosphate hydrolase protein n=1 Tax=Cladorrhinum samala TaxID=585594 RepID=A0AAV9HDE3_9PEZI|nr:P-loop containing nucleoside triphosphate hydrolase protein [Cladorrhinum samala]
MAPSSDENIPDPLEPELDLLDKTASSSEFECPISTPVDGEANQPPVTIIADDKAQLTSALLDDEKLLTKISVAEVLPTPDITKDTTKDTTDAVVKDVDLPVENPVAPAESTTPTSEETTASAEDKNAPSPENSDALTEDAITPIKDAGEPETGTDTSLEETNTPGEDTELHFLYELGKNYDFPDTEEAQTGEESSSPQGKEDDKENAEKEIKKSEEETQEDAKEKEQQDTPEESKEEPQEQVEESSNETSPVPAPAPEPKPEPEPEPEPEHDPFTDCKRVTDTWGVDYTEDENSPIKDRPGMPLLPALGRHLLPELVKSAELLAPEKEWQRQKRELGQKSRALDKLMTMVGIEDVKREFLAIRSTITTAKSSKKGKLRRQDFNLALVGNPGTGKRTLAGLYKELLHECGIWTSTPRSENKAGYDFQGEKDIESFNTTLASLTRGSNVFVFIDAIEGLYQSIRDDLLFLLDRHCSRIRLVVAIAGSEDAVNKFLAAKASGRWQFPRKIILKNYENEQLRLILLQMIKHNGFTVEGGYDGPYPRIAARRIGRNRDSAGFANVYDLILAFERMVQRHALRLEKERLEAKEQDNAAAAASKSEKEQETEKAADSGGEECSVEASVISPEAKQQETPTEKDKTEDVKDTKELTVSNEELGNTNEVKSETSAKENESTTIGQPESSDQTPSAVPDSTPQAKVDANETAKLNSTAQPEEGTEQEEKSEEKSQNKPGVSSEEKSEAKSEDKSDDNLGVKSDEISEEKSEDNPETKSEEKSEEKSEGKSEYKTEDNLEVKPEEKNEEKSEEMPEGKPEIKSEEKSEDKSEDKPEVKSGEKSEEKSEDIPEVKSQEKSQDKSEETPEVKSEEKADKKSEENSEDQPEDKPEAKSEEKSEKLEDKTENKPEEQAQRILTKEDLIGPEPEDTRHKSKAWQELSKMAGLESVKKAIGELLNRERANYRRELLEKEPLQSSLNRVFLGPPGTGKTTVAKLYGQILSEIGLLTTREVVFKTPGDFIGQYIGESETKTTQILDSTVGKVLIIDDAHMFYHGSRPGTSGEADEFRLACIDVIVSKIHNKPGENRCVILLGYPDMMEEMFRKANPGLRRRFPLEDAFRFENYDDKTLNEILRLKMSQEEITADEGAMEVAAEVLRRARDRPNFGNGGDVDNLLGLAKTRFRERYAAQRKLEAEAAKGKDEEQTINDLVFDAAEEDVKIVLRREDFDPEWNRGQHASKKCQALFEGLIGFSTIIEKFEGYQRIAANMRRRGRDPRDVIPFTFIFKGPPGTGKTHTARIVGQIFYDMGFLSTNEVIECSASNLIGQYLGQTAPKVVNLFERALGKVLFIDEAYRLNPGSGAGRHSYEEEAIGELVDCMTKQRYLKKMIIVLAGYEKDMDSLLQTNAGLRGRFGTEVVFPPMSASRAKEHLLNLLKKEDIELHDRIDPGTEEREKVVRFLHKLGQTPGWSNGRDLKTLAANITGSVYRNAILDDVDDGNETGVDTFKISTAELNGHLKDMLRQRNRST